MTVLVLGLGLGLGACGAGEDASSTSPSATAEASDPDRGESVQPTVETTADEPETASTTALVGSAPTPVVASTIPGTVPSPTSVPVDVGRVVIASDESVLADTLALGVPVFAANADVLEAGLQGMGELDTTGIEVFNSMAIGIEQIAVWEPDVLVVSEFMLQVVGEDQLAGAVGSLVVLPSGLSNREQISLLGEAFGREAEANRLIDDLDAKFARIEVPAGCEVSVVTVYAGPNISAYVVPEWDLPATLDEMGCTLVPGPDGLSTRSGGRADLSLEQLELLAAPTLVMAQTRSVEGEQAALDQVMSSPLWEALPAVKNDRVVVIDRFGYAGIVGQLRLIDDLLVAVS